MRAASDRRLSIKNMGTLDVRVRSAGGIQRSSGRCAPRPIGDYPLRTWEHLTFEYVLLGGFNDHPEDARRVAKLISNLRAKINLIPWNPGELPYRPPDPVRVEAFRKILADKGYPVFVRRSRGQDVMAACGQLALLESPQIAQAQILSSGSN